MNILIGLSNPSSEYEGTRHNSGALFLDFLAESNIPAGSEVKIELEGEKYILYRPDTFMNESGKAVSRILNFYKLPPEKLTIVHDDLDLKLGTWKIQMGKGPKVHNGVTSVEDSLGTTDFNRIRIGIDNRNETFEGSGSAYVLGKFSSTELERLQTVFKEIATQLHVSL